MTPWLLLLLLGVLLQSTLMPLVRLAGVHPDLLLVLVLTWGMRRGGREALVWGLVGGLLLDLFSVLPFGTFTVAMLTVGLLASLAEGLPFDSPRLLSAAVMLLAAPLFHTVALAMMQTLGWEVAWGSLWPRLLPAALLDVALTFLLYPLLQRLATLAGERSIDWA